MRSIYGPILSVALEKISVAGFLKGPGEIIQMTPMVTPHKWRHTVWCIWARNIQNLHLLRLVNTPAYLLWVNLYRWNKLKCNKSNKSNWKRKKIYKLFQLLMTQVGFFGFFFKLSELFQLLKIYKHFRLSDHFWLFGLFQFHEHFH